MSGSPKIARARSAVGHATTVHATSPDCRTRNRAAYSSCGRERATRAGFSPSKRRGFGSPLTEMSAAPMSAALASRSSAHGGDQPSASSGAPPMRARSSSLPP